MRIAEVIGRVTLSHRVEEVAGGKFLLVKPLRSETLRDGTPVDTEPLVAYDELGADLGCRVSISEGREAACPFWPKDVPVDAYCAAILDDVRVDAEPS